MATALGEFSLLCSNYNTDRTCAHSEAPVFFNGRHLAAQADFLLVFGVAHEAEQFAHEALSLLWSAVSTGGRARPNFTITVLTNCVCLCQWLANLLEARNNLVLCWMGLQIRRLVLETKTLENKVDSLTAVSFSAIEIVSVATSWLVDLVVPVEKPDSKVHEDSQLVALGFGPPCSSEEGEVGSDETFELALITENASV